MATPNEHSDLRPLEGNAVLTVAIGTAIWLVIGLALLPFGHRLNAAGHEWWIAVAFTAAGLGVVGLLVVVRRERRLQAAPQKATSTS